MKVSAACKSLAYLSTLLSSLLPKVQIAKVVNVLCALLSTNKLIPHLQVRAPA